MNSETPPQLPRQTVLAIDFVIIGAGITGLACTTALRRVGHRILVIEQKENIDVVAMFIADTTDIKATQETIHMYPNATRILYITRARWGCGAPPALRLGGCCHCGQADKIKTKSD
ncbi:hypothetical protein C8R44DRAFT_741506 [Mycena epipterygia]|nr:hypothetical protein C8R44DRAFT_741506 [Mycena epipterygia]